MSRHEMRAFLADRRRALLSDDPVDWRAYADAYGVRLPDDPEMVRRAIDKARTAALDLPLAVRKAAAERLRAVGWKPLDDGELT